MISELMKLLERFVVAVELIAANMKSNTTAAGPAATGPVKSKVPAAAGPVYPEDTDRDAWLALAKARGKSDWPKGTKTPTIVKWVRNYDLANPTNVQTSPEETKPEEKTVDALGDDALGDEVFDETEEVVTREDLLPVLQKVQKEKGNPVLIELLEKGGGVKAFKELTDDKYAAVKKLAEEVLK